MHAVLVGKDGRLVWSEVSDPVLRDDDVLLEIHAAALNRADLLQRAGQYPPPPGWPEWFGLEAAGVIRALGPTAQAEGKWHVGDAACALLGGVAGGLYTDVPSACWKLIPAGEVTLPDAGRHEEYARFAGLYRSIYASLKDNFDTLAGC